MRVDGKEKRGKHVPSSESNETFELASSIARVLKRHFWTYLKGESTFECLSRQIEAHASEVQ